MQAVEQEAGGSYRWPSMRWYYVNEAQERLAVEEAELPPLVRGGVLRPQTLVWHDGLAEWAAAGEVMPELFTGQRPPGSAATGTEVPLGRLAMDPLLRFRGWLSPLAAAALAAGAVDLPGALERFGRDPAGAVGTMVRIAFLLTLGCLLIQWLISQHRAARSGQLAELRAAAKSGGRVLALAGIAAILYLLSVIYSLIALAAARIVGQ
jgi:hypothetical protein